MKILTYRLGIMQTNCYIVIDELNKKAVIVDPADNAEKILNKINEKNCTLEYILLTHGHFDHIYALEEIRKKTNVPVCIHYDDADCITDSTISYMYKFTGKNIIGNPAEIMLNDGDIITVGDINIKVMHTPGHTMGSVCYIIDNIILTGDTLFQGNIGGYDFYGGDYMQILSSVKALSNLSGDYKIYPGHGGFTSLLAERENNIYLK